MGEAILGRASGSLLFKNNSDTNMKTEQILYELLQMQKIKLFM